MVTFPRSVQPRPASGDMTVLDTMMEFAYGLPCYGKLAMSGITAESLLGIFDTAGSTLPPCMQMELVDGSVVDPAGKTFAKTGDATRP
jgi:hypothetical protein